MNQVCVQNVHMKDSEPFEHSLTKNGNGYEGVIIAYMRLSLAMWNEWIGFCLWTGQRFEK